MGEIYAKIFAAIYFFFKQKTAYEIMPSLVGSEMCIRDRFGVVDSDFEDIFYVLDCWLHTSLYLTLTFMQLNYP